MINKAKSSFNTVVDQPTDISIDFADWILDQVEDFKKVDILKKFRSFNSEEADILLNELMVRGILLEVPSGGNIPAFMVSQIALVSKEKLYNDFKDIFVVFKGKSNIQKTELDFFINSWEDIKEIDKFVIYEGSERIYEICIKGKPIKLEGKEILDYNIFRLRFFEAFGFLLPTYRGISSDWSNLVNHWSLYYSETSKDKAEFISDSQEAMELIVDYVNSATLADSHILKEGVIAYLDSCLYLSTKIMKKILKRNDLRVSLRKLAYVMDNYLISGSIPLKIENKSERFWKLDPKKFEIDENKVLKVQEDSE